MLPIPELTTPLSDGHVALRHAAERDIPEILIAYQDDPQLHLRLGQARPPTGAQLGSRAERLDDDRVNGRLLTLTVLEAGSDICRGEVSLHHIEWEHARAEVGIWLVPQVRGRGLATRSLSLVAPWLFEACALERLAVVTELDNQPMLGTARGAGFVEEGVLRAYTRQRGVRKDNALLSLLPSDLVR